MNSRIHGRTNRYLCDILEEMRTCLKTLNFSYLESLIEEAQMRGNRMEAALIDRKDILSWINVRSELKAEIHELEKKLEKMKSQLPKKGQKSEGKD